MDAFVVVNAAVNTENGIQRGLRLFVLRPTNPHFARVVGYGPFFLCVIHKKGKPVPQQWGH
jgi:hypothetical protein